ncbi:putative major facilitator superfamily general substrate transporter [Rosellinia necatrix]|uniref:Putative major facilitator superfamily general substrate transporter n=1 Tax=Rosellinia necatrix TaxID=77044 RepID=A0A1S7UP03_ROSNE|nr:putative major facilitator superfamily general substrate transporter [Rosellinia necatrix]
MADIPETHEASPAASVTHGSHDVPAKSQGRGWRFWVVLVALGITSLGAAVESTVISTALPRIAEALDAKELYVWFANAYTLTSTAFLPLLGQMADIFGRRWITIAVVAAFALGSGISGGASSATMLIAGRAVQGIGGGGIILMIEMIVCDLVPLRDRGRFTAVILGVFGIVSSLGPFIGGAIVEGATWRWVFYINLPICGLSLILLLCFLHLNYDRAPSVVKRLRRIDYFGNILLIASVAAILIALSYGGTRYVWSDWRVLLPLIIGFVGVGAFLLYEASPWCVEPVTPLRLFQNRTSAVSFFLTFIHSLLSFWVLYFLPVYFQAVQLENPSRSGVLLLPTAIVIIPGSIVGGAVLSKFGKYKVVHLAGVALMAVGTGTFILFDENSSLATYVSLQIVAGLGSGLLLAVLLPAVQAALTEKDTALSTATWSFIRTFGTIWGVSIPAAIFNSRSNDLSKRIDDPAVRALIAHGQAYSHATSDFLLSLPDHTREQVVSVFSDSLNLVWIVATAIAGASFLTIFLEKDITLRTQLDTEYGLEDTKAMTEGEIEKSSASKEKGAAASHVAEG